MVNYKSSLLILGIVIVGLLGGLVLSADKTSGGTTAAITNGAKAIVERIVTATNDVFRRGRELVRAAFPDAPDSLANVMVLLVGLMVATPILQLIGSILLKSSSALFPGHSSRY